MTNPSISSAGTEFFQPFLQPYVHLTQRNMQLLTKLSSSPEMVSMWMANGQRMFSQAVQETAAGKAEHEPRKATAQVHDNLMEMSKSKAFAGLIQGLMQSQMQFLADLAQTNMTAFSQAPIKMMGEMQKAASKSGSLTLDQAEPAAPAKRKAH
jgi:hypothetical protein